MSFASLLRRLLDHRTPPATVSSDLRRMSAAMGGVPGARIEHTIAERSGCGPGYVAKLLALVGTPAARPGSVRVISVTHSWACRALRTGRPWDCACDPEITVGPDLKGGDS